MIILQVLLSPFYYIQPVLAETIQQKNDSAAVDTIGYFWIMLFGLVVLIYIKRRTTVRASIGLIFGSASYFAWFSNKWSAEYNIDVAEQRIIAIALWSIAVAVLILKSRKKERRKSFSELVRREAIRKQKGKCAICKRKLDLYGRDFDHKNGDRSNNKISNCQALCTSCHRRKHAE